MDPSEAQALLNPHGVFLKKRLISEVKTSVPGLFVLDEEVGNTFGETRVADLVCFQASSVGTIFYIIECKRVAKQEWLFVRHVNPQYREMRLITIFGQGGDLVDVAGTSDLVCSEGFETKDGDSKKCNQTPVFQAAAQLSGAYLGFIRRLKLKGYKLKMGFIPMLVTTARLQIADFSPTDIELKTGLLMKHPQIRDVPWLVLKHPFPTPESLDHDFRLENEGHMSAQTTAESIYVVRADAIQEFLSQERLAHLLGLLGSL